MVAFLLVSIFIIGFISLLIYRWRRPKDRSGYLPLQPGPPPPPLFGPNRSQTRALEADERRRQLAVDGAAWVERARAGERAVLGEIDHRANRPAYDAALTALVEREESASFAELSMLAGYVIENELPANRTLTLAVLEHCRHSPDRSAAIMLLHLAARTNDAEVYLQAFDILVQARATGQLSTLSANELMTLADSEFWLLDEFTRNSGAGFLLKQKLANARRELAAAARDGQAAPER